MRFLFTTIVSIVFSIAFLGTDSHAQSSHPDINLPMQARGAQAINALGQHLPAVAKAYGITKEELIKRLTEDRDLWVDRKGRLFFTCEGMTVPQPSTAAGEPAVAAASPYPLDQTFQLHSRSGAQRVIYLDFNGHVITGCAWNSYTGVDPINAPAFDTDGNPAPFSTNELTVIQQVWQRVAEDYAGFDVDVTTEDPGAAAITRTNSTDQVYGTRALISPISQYFGAYGGIAYVGVFNYYPNDYYKPALIFPERLGNTDKNIAEAASHEVGHNLGLSHDGTPSTGYYSGHGSGETGWAPIMGVGYYQNLSQWSKGEYANANNTEDDLAIIQNYGLPYRTDDHGNTAAAATVLPAGSAISASGRIERNTDVDVFAFNSGSGTINVSVVSAPRGPNLDILVELRNSAGALLATANPTNLLSATLTASVSSGTYYLHVKGTGNGDPLLAGYTNYGSLGVYSLAGTVPNPTGQIPPTAVLSANPTSGTAPLTVQFDGSQSTDQDGSIVSYAWTFGDGGSASGPTVSHTYAAAGSYTATLTVTDNTGLTSSSSTTITAQAQQVTVRVESISMSVSGTKTKQVRAVVRITTTTGAAVSGASVTGTWSGIISGTTTGTSDTNGYVTLSKSTKRTGSVTFRVSTVTKSGATYDATKNLVTQASITVP
jgi:PKD repeat protein